MLITGPGPEPDDGKE